MSRVSHRKYLENAALREAQKAISRAGRENFSKDDLLRLRIQTVEPWKRVALALIGLLLGAAAITAFLKGPHWLGYPIAILAITFLLLALFGRKRTIDAALDSIDILSLTTGLFDGF